MSAQETLRRPLVMESLTETQLRELEFQAAEYDREDFFRIGANYGWDDTTTQAVWKWFEVQHTYPLEGTVVTN